MSIDWFDQLTYAVLRIIGRKMVLQAKKTFAMVDYEICDPERCDPEHGICAAASACTHKVLKQIDGAFEPPVVFQDLCMACWDCMEACPLDAIQSKNIS
jgi:ATP-binding cassette subfamily E protein 1